MRRNFFVFLVLLDVFCHEGVSFSAFAFQSMALPCVFLCYLLLFNAIRCIVVEFHMLANLHLKRRTKNRQDSAVPS